MPVTARLSRKFYEKLGDEVAGELVDLLNTMDASYRAEYRELLDARLGQFSAELRGEVGLLRAETDTFRAELRADMKSLSVELRAEMAKLHAELTVRLKSQEGRLMKWMLTLWLSSTIILAGMIWAH